MPPLVEPRSPRRKTSALCPGKALSPKWMGCVTPWATLSRVSEEGKTPLMVAGDGKYLGLIATADRLKPHAKEAVAALSGLGVRTVMLTGDNERTARAADQRLSVKSPKGERDASTRHDGNQNEIRRAS